MPTLRLDEVTVAYEQFGEGPDIVWVSGGGGLGSTWHEYQIPYFEGSFRNTTFDNRGIGKTVCHAPPPWSIADLAADAAGLIEAVCDPPVAVVGLSMGALIGQQLALDRPELLRCVVAMGTAARSVGFLDDWMRAEVQLRREGKTIEGMFALTHNVAFRYPASVLGDEEKWATIKRRMTDAERSAAAETSLIDQWEACIEFDCLERLPECTVPLHVVAFAEDLQTPPALCREVADAAPTAEYHLFEGMAHCSLYGHTHEELNPFIKGLVERYV